MGNQLIKGYDIEKETIGFGGINSQWKIYQGKKQDKSKQTVSIFIFEKKSIEKLPKSSKEEFLAVMRKEAQTLAKYKHPNILSIVEPLLEDPKSMAFITERVESSLISLINANKISDIYSSELETKFHILDIIDGITFLHDDIKMAHLSLSPENIYITQSGKWKIAGFIFATQIVSDSVVDCPTIDFSGKLQGNLNELKLTPMLHFSAPEVADVPSKCHISSDIFSLGCLIYTIFKVHADGNNFNPYLVTSNSYNGYKDAIKNLDKQNYQFIPQSLRPLIFKMITSNRNRVRIREIANCALFKDPFIQTVRYLETLHQKDYTQQQQFLKGIGKILLKFEQKFIKSKILPIICNLMKNDQLSSSILPIFCQIMDKKDIVTKSEFYETIWPTIKNLATGKEMPAQSLYLLILNLAIFVEYLEKEDLQIVILPLMIKSYECGVQKLQDLALKNTELLIKKIDYNAIKTKILPRILNLCIDANIEVRKTAILCLQNTYTMYDKNAQSDQILNTLEKVRKMSNNHKINMAILNIFEGISNSIELEVIL